MKAFDRVLTTFGILLLLSFRADAHDPSMAHHEWFNAQEMNPAARDRLGVPWKSCCDNGDVFKTRFRVGEDRSDQWQYLKNGEWKTIPPDIIKEGDTPDHTPRAVHQQIHGNGALLLCTARRYLMNGLDPIPHLKVTKAPPDSKVGCPKQ